MTDYSKMSDFEINKAVALCCTIEGVVINDDGDPVRNLIDDSPGSYSGGDYYETDFDPCNNPSDSWPIIKGYGIGVMPFTTSPAKAWPLSVGLLSDASVEHENPLRAAMVVFLMMKDEENAPAI